MNELFWIFLAFAIGCVIFVSIQAMIIFELLKQNKELVKELELNKPPF